MYILSHATILESTFRNMCPYCRTGYDISYIISIHIVIIIIYLNTYYVIVKDASPTGCSTLVIYGLKIRDI